MSPETDSPSTSGQAAPPTHASPPSGLIGKLLAHVKQQQHRNAYYLMLNSITGAAAGLLFWLILARIAGLPPSEIGVGYAIISLGTIVGVVAKGGLDTALVRTVPGANHREGVRLLWFAILFGTGAAILVSLGIALASATGNLSEDVRTPGWGLVPAIGILLVVTWLQDAYFLAEGDARYSFQRNLVFSAGRLLLALPIAWLALPRAAALTWAVALLLSAIAAALFAHYVPHREGRRVPRREFLQSAARNISGSAAEFLPGLMLVPLVLAVEGPDAAAYFGMAWTAASLLFLGSAAISRSAFAEMVRGGLHGQAKAIRRGARQTALVVLPGALLGAIVAPFALHIFGADYAREAGLTVSLLCLSTFVVAPVYLYLGYLRAREHPMALIVFPAAMVSALAVLAPLLVRRLDLPGAALAWLAANLPFALYATWKLRHAAQEVIAPEPPAPTLGAAAHVE